MKLCTSCNQEKAVTEFYKCARWDDGLQKQCKTCHKGHNTRHYMENKSVYIRRAKDQHSDVLELVRLVKEESGCIRCGESKWWRLAFHHLDPSTKEIDLGLSRSLPQAIKEMKKCIVVCHTCHADIHHEERHGSVAQLAE